MSKSTNIDFEKDNKWTCNFMCWVLWWDDLTNDPKFKDLVKAAEDKLAKASQSKGKGKAVSA